MQDTSQIENFDSVIASGDYYTETKLNINGIDYFESELIGISTSSALFSDTPSVGNCYSGEIDIEMISPKNRIIPRMARLKPYVRVYAEEDPDFVVNAGSTTLVNRRGSVVNETARFVNDASVDGETLMLTNHTSYITSGWLQKGEYFIDTRMVTHNTVEPDILEIHGYDAMLKAESVYPVDNADYPKSDVYVVNLIARTMGILVDPRTYEIMADSNMINLPATYTMREVLGYIGSMYAGNFCITPEGKLRLVGLSGIGIQTNYLIDEHGDAITFGGDRILV